MKVLPIISLLSLLFCSLPQTEGVFLEERSARLIDAISSTPLGSSNGTDIPGVIDAVRLQFPNCRPEVCFALDGSASISEEEYGFQTNFAQVVTAVLGGLTGSSFSANQYGGITEIISPRTSTLLGSSGLLALLRRSSLAASPITFIAPGFQFCVGQLSEGSNSTSSRIVLLGDGESNFAPDSGRLGAATLAMSFLNSDEKNGILGVLVGGNNATKTLFGQIVGREDRLVQVPDWNEVGQALMSVVTETCS